MTLGVIPPPPSSWEMLAAAKFKAELIKGTVFFCVAPVALCSIFLKLKELPTMIELCDERSEEQRAKRAC